MTDKFTAIKNGTLVYGPLILKETDKMIGQCGLTMQQWKDQEVLEIGLSVRKITLASGICH